MFAGAVSCLRHDWPSVNVARLAAEHTELSQDAVSWCGSFQPGRGKWQVTAYVLAGLQRSSWAIQTAFVRKSF
jgi:hypothetical protein